MAQVILSTVGTTLGGPIGGAIGSAIGSFVDRAAINALRPDVTTGSRLSGLQLSSTSVGAPMPAAFGRARVAGQVIWAANFKERRVEQASGGGKGGPRTYAFAYSLSFAVALGEGPIDGVGRVWADGRPMDLSAVTMRVHLGGADQTPDPLIEAIEGAAPAYRGTAYLVFEDLPLDAYGNRPPQVAAEVFRRPRGAGLALEDRLTGVNLIPGAGEFVLATEPVIRRTGAVSWASETVHTAQGRPDLLVALDALQAQLPNVTRVNLVVAWFGDDLRCGRCSILPGVEAAVKETRPQMWEVAGLGRDAARLISTSGGGPAYGGTPSDAAVLQAITELKARGIAVTLYPFLLMDVPPGNGLADPYGGAAQAAYPWRGRITGEVAPGRSGTTDLTAAAATQSASFFDGDDGYARFVRHYADLAVKAGGVDGFLIGSELTGLTTLRSGPGVYPAVAKLKTLAADVKATVGAATQVGYAADWSEWNAHADGTGDLRFHLDPLWSDAAIDFVGIDFYPPLADWRAGDGGLDAAIFGGPHDPAYLAANVSGGEDFDWFYASPADRAAQARTPITDGAYGEPWVYRAKDLVGWWSNAHHDRPGGVRSAAATGWVPKSKPIRLVEFGCPAVDRGANSPNLFVDPKSAESSLPPFSTGARDDLGQRRAVEAVLAHFADPSANPTSTVYGGPMVEALDAWCWDARPYPDFPARTDVWADGGDWLLGHWLTGRVGSGSGADLVNALFARAGLTADEATGDGVAGGVLGYVLDGPQSTADALQPLTLALGFDVAERGGRVEAVAREGAPALALAVDDLSAEGEAADPRDLSRVLSPTPDLVRVRFLEEAADYQAGSAVLRAQAPGGGGPDTLSLPVVTDAAGAQGAAERRLARALAERDALTVRTGPLAALTAEPGDLVSVEGADGLWRVVRADVDETPRLSMTRAEVVAPVPAGAVPTDWRPAPPAVQPVPPALLLLDLPPLDGREDDARPLAAVAASPWRVYDLSAGPDADALSIRATATEPATLGETLTPLPPGPLWRWDRATTLDVRVDSGALVSRTAADVLGGANALAILRPDGEAEIVQFTVAAPLGGGAWRLSMLLRGQQGSDDPAGATIPAGAAFALLDADLVRAQVAGSERGLPLTWRAAPSGGPSGGLAMEEAAFTWRGIAWRPWSPAHLRAMPAAAGVALSWVRRARVHGDGWDGADPPLGEESESYRVQVLSDGAIVREWTSAAPQTMYAAADLAADFPGPPPASLTVCVSQESAVFGWGVPAQRELWL